MSFRHAHAGATDWQHAVEQCVDQLGALDGRYGLGFVYLSDHYASDAAAIVARLRDHTGVGHWVGTVGIGVCSTGVEALGTPAISVLVGALPPGSFRVLPRITDPEQITDEMIACGREPGHVAVVHADPSTPGLQTVIEALSDRLVSSFVVGGLASSRGRAPLIADAVHEGGLSGVVLSSAVTIATRLTQGCAPAGPRRTITACHRNVISKIDGRPALDVFDEDVGEKLARDYARAAGLIFAALPVAGSDTGDYLVRNLVGVDPDSRLLAIGELVEPGMAVQFCRRDADTARQDMQRVLRSLRESLDGAPRGALYFSCLGRGESLFGPGSVELGLIARELGEFPLAGFFCNGEISHNRLYGYTGVLLVFP